MGLLNFLFGRKEPDEPRSASATEIIPVIGKPLKLDVAKFSRTLSAKDWFEILCNQTDAGDKLEMECKLHVDYRTRGDHLFTLRASDKVEVMFTVTKEKSVAA